MTGKDIFDNILPKKLSDNAQLFSSLGITSKSLRLQLDGPNGGDWTVGFDAAGTAKVTKNDAANSTAHIQMSDESFTKLIEGQLNVPMALITRKIKVSGDKSLAIKIGESLRSLLG